MGAAASLEGDPLTPDTLRERLEGRPLSEHEWYRLLGKGVIAVQTAFERSGDYELPWSEIADASSIEPDSPAQKARRLECHALVIKRLCRRRREHVVVREKGREFYEHVSGFVHAKRPPPVTRSRARRWRGG